MAEKIDYAAIPQTVIRVITSPSAFYRDMPKSGGFVEPLVFIIVMGCIAGIIQTVFNFVLHFSDLGFMAKIMSLIMMPIFVAIGSFIGAAILFIIWKLMGSQESYETSYRCVAYLSAITPITTLIGLIPYLGTVIGMLIGLLYIVTASVEVHAIPSKKAWLVFGVITAVLCFGSLSATFKARQFADEAAVQRKQAQEAAKVMQRAAEQMQRQAAQGQPVQQLSPEQQKQMQEAQKTLEDLQRQMPQQESQKR
jgi:hypothetical protein